MINIITRLNHLDKSYKVNKLFKTVINYVCIATTNSIFISPYVKRKHREIAIIIMNYLVFKKLEWLN